MKLGWIVPIGLLVSLGWSCSGSPERQPQEPRTTGTDVSAPRIQILPWPFTADEIRSEWIVGFQLKMKRTTPETEEIERWRVVSADGDGVDIEFVAVDSEGNVGGEPNVVRFGWVELRDHAAFSVGTAKREETARETSLGRHEGWLYTVRDDEEGTLTEYFFAKGFPGAPLHMRTMRGGELVREMSQIERHRPGA